MEHGVPFSSDVNGVSRHILSLADESESSVELLLSQSFEVQNRTLWLPLQVSAEWVGGFRGSRKRVGGAQLLVILFSSSCWTKSLISVSTRASAVTFWQEVWVVGREGSLHQICACRKGSAWKQQGTPSNRAHGWQCEPAAAKTSFWS